MKILKIKSKDIITSTRFNSSYHLSEGTIYLKKLIQMPHTVLEKITTDIFTAGRSKRIYTEAKFGYPYLSNSDVVRLNPIGVCKYNSKKYGFDEPSFLKAGMIVTGRVGAVGQTAFITSEFEEFEAMGSDNIIRLVVNEKTKSGYVYAFLTSKFGKTLLSRLSAGGVQPYISEDMLKDMPIPNLSEGKRQVIHDSILNASSLRVKANKLLQEADELFHTLNAISYKDYQISTSENQKYLGFEVRMDKKKIITIKAKNYSKRVLEIQEQWQNKRGILLKDYVVKPFRIGPRGTFKRIDSETIGTEMVSQSDLHRINPRNFKRVIISAKNEEDWGTDNQVLFPAVGNGSSEGEILFRPTLSFKSFSNRLLSGDIGRLDCSSLSHAAYLMVALSSKGGFRMLRAYYYGTQLRRPLWELIKGINIPIKDDECFKKISTLVIDAYELRFEADVNENNAINLIEKEIESWQK